MAFRPIAMIGLGNVRDPPVARVLSSFNSRASFPSAKRLYFSVSASSSSNQKKVQLKTGQYRIHFWLYLLWRPDWCSPIASHLTPIAYRLMPIALRIVSHMAHGLRTMAHCLYDLVDHMEIEVTGVASPYIYIYIYMYYRCI